MDQILFSPIELSDLDQLIQNSVKKALASSTQAPSPEQPDRLNVDQACKLLNRTRSWIFKKTMLKEIPFGKFGSRLVFSRKELEAWMESQTIPVENPSGIMAERLAKTAKRRDK